MTRDTFDRFRPPDRGRFGDAEHAGERVTRSNLVDLDLYLHNDNPAKKAIAVSLDPRTPFEKWAWLARSLIEYEATRPGQVRVAMPESLAQSKGLI